MIYDRLSFPQRAVAVIALAIAAPILWFIGHAQGKFFGMVVGELCLVIAVIGAVPIVRHYAIKAPKGRP